MANTNKKSSKSKSVRSSGPSKSLETKITSILEAVLAKSNVGATIAPVSASPAPTVSKAPKVMTPEYLSALHKNRAAYHGYIAKGGLPVPTRKRDANRRFIKDEAFEAARNAYREYLKDGVIRLSVTKPVDQPTSEVKSA